MLEDRAPRTEVQLAENQKVDSFRYVDFATRKVLQAWMGREDPGEIPWTPSMKPVSESRLAIVSTAGLAVRGDRPFDVDGERRNPWWGDPSYREIPVGTRTGDVQVGHLHIDVRVVEEDLDCVLPLTRAAELQAAGELGALAPTHFSFMGYLLRPDEFLRSSVPAMIERLRSEEVEIVLLVPV